jgi:hypothetical protein
MAMTRWHPVHLLNWVWFIETQGQGLRHDPANVIVSSSALIAAPRSSKSGIYHRSSTPDGPFVPFAAPICNSHSPFLAPNGTPFLACPCRVPAVPKANSRSSSLKLKLFSDPSHPHTPTHISNGVSPVWLGGPGPFTACRLRAIKWGAPFRKLCFLMQLRSKQQSCLSSMWLSIHLSTYPNPYQI